jgi:hypothetical protein
MYDMAHPFGSCWRVKNECKIVVRSTMAQMLVANVSVEHDHGLRMRVRCPRHSGVPSDVLLACTGLLTTSLASSDFGSML